MINIKVYRISIYQIVYIIKSFIILIFHRTHVSLVYFCCLECVKFYYTPSLKLTQTNLTEKDNSTISELLHTIGDFERIGDHAINMVKISHDMHENKLEFSEEAKTDLITLFAALTEISELAVNAYLKNDISLAMKVEPLEEVINNLTAKIKHKHIERMQKGLCKPELGVYISDLLIFLERISDHYSNIAVVIIQIAHANLYKHDYLNELRTERTPHFVENYNKYEHKYRLAKQST